jgi:hypothetical protein
MRSTKTTLIPLLVGVSVALAASLMLAPTSVRAVPRDFFGIAPQTTLTQTDVDYMRAGRIGSVRWPLTWESVQPEPNGEYDWSGFDEIVRTAALGRLRVLPFIYATPDWLARKFTTLPVDGARKRRLWRAFVVAAVSRYGRGGEFWREHGPGTEEPVPNLPVREWQVWNEANFFYFTYPASPTRYARLLKLTSAAIRLVDPAARIMLSGLFGDPTARPPNAMPAVPFLERLYAVPGIKAHFDGVALHPYADGAARLEELTEEVRQVALDNHDPGVRLYITEMGWGSQNNPNIVSFERGIRGQVRELRLAYRYLIANRGRLNLKAAYWFTWKDLPEVCNFCDSVGFFHRGDRLRAKPAWHAFVGLTGGRPRP